MFLVLLKNEEGQNAGFALFDWSKYVMQDSDFI